MLACTFDANRSQACVIVCVWALAIDAMVREIRYLTNHHTKNNTTSVMTMPPYTSTRS